MDKWIADRKYDRTLTIAHSCLEGFLKAFVKAKLPQETHLKDILDLAKAAKGCIRKTIRSIRMRLLGCSPTLHTPSTSHVTVSVSRISVGNPLDAWRFISETWLTARLACCFTSCEARSRQDWFLTHDTKRFAEAVAKRSNYASPFRPSRTLRRKAKVFLLQFNGRPR